MFNYDGSQTITIFMLSNSLKHIADNNHFGLQHFFSSFLSRETVYKLLVQVWDEVKNKQQVSINNDNNNIIIIIIKKFGKINNYSELGVEIARVSNMWREVVPVVIDVNLHRHLESLGIKVHVSMLQKSALLGTATGNILRKVLLSEVIDLIDKTLYVNSFNDSNNNNNPKFQINTWLRGLQ